MRILIGKSGYVDFETPIYMTDEQKEIFINGMKKIFSDVKIKHVDEMIIEMDASKTEAKKWDVKELLLLVRGLTNEEVAEKTGRDRFSVRMKRGSWLLPIQSWARKRGLSEITIEDIKEFERERVG